MRADLRGDQAARAYRNRNDDEIGAFGGGGIGLHDLVSETQFRDPTARRGGAGGGDDGAGSALRARRARDGGADQAHSDQRDAIENGLPAHLPPRIFTAQELRQRVDDETVGLLATDA